jgi:hypothetical protein
VFAAGTLTRSGQRQDRRAEQRRYGHGAQPVPQNG